jgi:hypothetical protein
MHRAVFVFHLKRISHGLACKKQLCVKEKSHGQFLFKQIQKILNKKTKNARAGRVELIAQRTFFFLKYQCFEIVQKRQYIFVGYSKCTG